MVMEHLQGQDLADMLRQRNQIPVREAVGYVLEACEALAEAHSHGIVHRDLKPGNLFLALQPDRRSIVKVLDFGISKVAEGQDSKLTKTEAVIGTPYYMSPDQLVSSKHVDHRTDIWSMGVILYEMLAGRLPFEADTLPEIVALILQNKPTPIQELVPELPTSVAEAVHTCLATMPSDRFADVGALALALADGAAHLERARRIQRVLGEAEAPASVDHSTYRPPSASTPNEAPAAVVAAAAAGIDKPGTLDSVSRDIVPPAVSSRPEKVRVVAHEAGPLSNTQEVVPNDGAKAMTQLSQPPSMRIEPERRFPWLPVGIVAGVVACGAIWLAQQQSGGASAQSTATTSEVTTAVVAPAETVTAKPAPTPTMNEPLVSPSDSALPPVSARPTSTVRPPVTAAVVVGGGRLPTAVPSVVPTVTATVPTNPLEMKTK
jgi:eukaryotic-like serine/threonine-protein kinase